MLHAEISVDAVDDFMDRPTFVGTTGDSGQPLKWGMYGCVFPDPENDQYDRHDEAHSRHYDLHNSEAQFLLELLTEVGKLRETKIARNKWTLDLTPVQELLKDGKGEIVGDIKIKSYLCVPHELTWMNDNSLAMYGQSMTDVALNVMDQHRVLIGDPYNDLIFLETDADDRALALAE